METMQEKKDLYYGPQWYDLDKQTLAGLKELQPHKPVLAALAAWLWIFVIVKAYLRLDLVWLYPVAVFLIAGRAGVFLQLAHEAAHGLVARGRFNDWFGDWVACYPLGLDLKGYQEPHIRHHACTNQPCDPMSDREKYKLCDVRQPKLWLLFLKDLLGITAVSIRFLYDQPEANQYKEDEAEGLEAEEGYEQFRDKKSFGSPVRKYLSIAFVQSLILGALFDFNLLHYLLLWAVPLVTAHMFLMRVRGIAEHGLGVQLHVPNLEKKTRGIFFTRSFGTPMSRYRFPLLNLVEQWLIGSLNIYYHHEHHLFPKIPYYNLPKVHRLVAEQERANNPYVFAKGYFDCLLFSLRNDVAVPHPKPNFP